MYLFHSRRTATILFASVVVLGLTANSVAQPAQAGTLSEPVQSEASLTDQVVELQATVARLQAALEQNHQGTPSVTSPASGSSGMGAVGKMGTMGKMDAMGKMDGMGKIGGMGKTDGMGKMGGMGKTDGMDKMDGMGMMGGMKMTSAMATPSALPGFPGASHLYHIGQTGFFLNHDEHIELSTEQRVGLSQIKEKALLEKNSADRQIEQAEQDLWELTASDEPDASKIENQIREIEKLRGDQRLQFIRAVGEAAQILTPEQQKALLGQESSQSTATADQHQH